MGRKGGRVGRREAGWVGRERVWMGRKRVWMGRKGGRVGGHAREYGWVVYAICVLFVANHHGFATMMEACICVYGSREARSANHEAQCGQHATGSGK